MVKEVKRSHSPETLSPVEERKFRRFDSPKLESPPDRDLFEAQGKLELAKQRATEALLRRPGVSESDRKQFLEKIEKDPLKWEKRLASTESAQRPALSQEEMADLREAHEARRTDRSHNKLLAEADALLEQLEGEKLDPETQKVVDMARNLAEELRNMQHESFLRKADMVKQHLDKMK